MSRLAIYESKVVEVVFAGISIADGRADPFFSIAPQGPAYVVEGPGADGHVTRCGTNNNLYTITLTLKGTSSEHAKLQAVHIADRIASNGSGVAPILCKDGNGSTLVSTDRCWIATFNELAFGITRPDVAWELHAVIEPGNFQLGGS
jgi:hypothetical protein